MFFAPAIRGESLLPSPTLDTLDSAFERFMTDTFRGFGPLHDLQDDGQSVTLSMDVPGVAKEHLQVSVEGRTVRIETSKDATRQIRASYELAEEVNPDGCSASLENGVLTLKLAKAQPIQRRQIAVN
jgi:HSP20 family protein